MKVDFKA